MPTPSLIHFETLDLYGPIEICGLILIAWIDSGITKITLVNSSGSCLIFFLVFNLGKYYLSFIVWWTIDCPLYLQIYAWVLLSVLPFSSILEDVYSSDTALSLQFCKSWILLNQNYIQTHFSVSDWEYSIFWNVYAIVIL